MSAVVQSASNEVRALTSPKTSSPPLMFKDHRHQIRSGIISQWFFLAGLFVAFFLPRSAVLTRRYTELNYRNSECVSIGSISGFFFLSFFLFFFYSRFTSLPPPFWFMAECHGGRAGRRLSISSAFFLFIFLFLVFFSLLLLLHIPNARHPVGSQREREREKEKEFPCPAVLQRHRHELRSVALHWIESSEWKKRIQWNKMSVASREKKSTRPFFVIKQSIDNRMEVIDFGPTSDQDVVFKLTPKKK